MMSYQFANFAILPPKGLAESRGSATDWRILRHKKRRLTGDAPPSGRKCGDNTGDKHRCAKFAIAVAIFAIKRAKLARLAKHKWQRDTPEIQRTTNTILEHLFCSVKLKDSMFL
jgi:hypothetical protein